MIYKRTITKTFLHWLKPVWMIVMSHRYMKWPRSDRRGGGGVCIFWQILLILDKRQLLCSRHLKFCTLPGKSIEKMYLIVVYRATHTEVFYWWVYYFWSHWPQSVLMWSFVVILTTGSMKLVTFLGALFLRLCLLLISLTKYASIGHALDLVFCDPDSDFVKI